ncbi:hypothetical protein NKV53_11060 [Legionella sp. 27cVA30]|uniref:hypothetical protein n=1 Tax=Legionella TaxID=445 RepID=UPI000F8EB4F0|nr:MULTISPECIES: hypothetical protein [Legionella]MCP0914865.1 hypothetical protein [Legionella sp. 27cVA30]RUR16792.1 hypothetical protein ELY10_02635 [Legionella septentrionalis]
MKKFIIFFLTLFCLSTAYGSKLSKFLNKLEAEEKAEQQRERQLDMNFSDFEFRFERRYTDSYGKRCREYEFRSRSNPYRHGQYTVCDDR